MFDLHIILDFEQGHATELREMVSSIAQVVNSALSIRCFYRPDIHVPGKSPLTFAYCLRDTYLTFPVHNLCRHMFGEEILPVTTIPCRFISSRDVDDWDLAFCIVTASGHGVQPT